jgi:hypothetical protein
MKRFLGLSILLLAAFSCVATPQKVSGTTPITINPSTGLVLPAANNVSTNWQNAGLAVVGGIPTRSKRCGSTVNPVGASPTDATNINAAIAACTPGDVVQLGAGTAVSISASITNNTMTVTAGSGLSVGMVLFDTTGVLMPGTTITAGSGSTWTVSYASYNGTSYTVPSETMTAVLAFQINQASEYIKVNKSAITLRGSGSYSSGGYWPTVINFYNGSIPDWTISPTTNNQNCGATSATASGCSVGNPMISVGANGSGNNGWAGIHTGTNTSTSGFGTTLAADAAQGATTIQVASTANFTVGRWFLIEENPALTTTTNPISGNASIQASPDFLSSSSSPATNRVANPDGSEGGTSYSWSLWPNLVNQEIKLIAAIGAGPCPGTNCTLTFDDPLTIAFRQSGGHNSQVYWPTACCSKTYTPFVTQAGVENLEITRGYNAILVEFCAYCWVKNVEIAGFLSGAVSFEWAVRSELTGSYLHHCFDCENIGVEYPLAVDAGSTEVLVDNNIIRLGAKGMVGRAAGGGNVVAYNYFGEGSYQQQSIGDWWQDEYVNGSHYAGSHHFLFEGNWGSNCDADETHGNTVYDTFFRNDCTALRPPFTDPSNTSLAINDTAGTTYCGRTTCGAKVANPPGPLFSAGPMAFDYWFAYVGNVLGTSGQTTTANGWKYQCSVGGTTNTPQGNKCLWMSGRTGSEWTGSGDPNLNLTAGRGAYLFKSGNYDYVTASINDWASGYSQTLPNSLYLSSAPAFLGAGTCTYPWAWVTPTSTTKLQPNSCGGSGLPAKARWDAGTPFKQP